MYLAQIHMILNIRTTGLILTFTDTTMINDIQQRFFIVTGLESGNEYFFRVRAVNDQGESGWSEIKSAIVGKSPQHPRPGHR